MVKKTLSMVETEYSKGIYCSDSKFQYLSANALCYLICDLISSKSTNTHKLRGFGFENCDLNSIYSTWDERNNCWSKFPIEERSNYSSSSSSSFCSASESDSLDSASESDSLESVSESSGSSSQAPDDSAEEEARPMHQGSRGRGAMNLWSCN